MTPSIRAFDHGTRGWERGGPHIEPTDLLAALADESESRAAVLMAEFGWIAIGSSS